MEMKNTIAAILSSYSLTVLAAITSMPDFIAIISGIAGTLLTIAAALVKWAEYKKIKAETNLLQKKSNDES